MIKGGFRKDDSTAESLRLILDDSAVAKIGAAGLLNSDVLNSLGMEAMVARSEIPPSHRRIANSYMLMKNFYGTPVVQGQITKEELNLLRKYDFYRLEYCTVRQINEDIAFLQRQSISLNTTARMDADKILEIRAKELRFLAASRYTKVTNELNSGYLAIEKYFEMISTYSKPTQSV